MDKIAQDIVYHLAELQYEHDHNTGQRWPIMLSTGKQNILNFRSVCKAFRDASWIPFRDILAERIFYLNEDELVVLDSIARHQRLGPLVTTVTLGSQVFTSRGLEILERGLESHPSHVEHNSAASPGWQRGLASRCDLCYDELVHFKELYEQELSLQEDFWSTGAAVKALGDCLLRLPNARSIRIYPRPCHVTFQSRQGEKQGSLSFASRQRNQHFIPHGAVNNMRCNGWRNVDRTLVALGKLAPRKLALEVLCTSSVSNVRWAMGSSIFTNPALFSSLRKLQLSIREDTLAGDEVYAVARASEDVHSFTSCLLASKHLKVLDLEISHMGEEIFSSYALAQISRMQLPFQLEHLTLEYNCQSEATLTELVRPHAATLKRLVLLNTWLTQGTWKGWLNEMGRTGLDLDFMEVWKPCQEGREYFRQRDNWFPLGVVSTVAKKGKVVPFLLQEQWENCYPRFETR